MDTKFVGRWRITSMELWDREAIDMVEPAWIEFSVDQQGNMGFIVVRGFLDVRDDSKNDQPVVAFSWEGHDDGHPVSGRGVAHIQPDGQLSGRIFFHMGDDSSFTAVMSERS